MKKIKVLFISYVDIKKVDSGSGVRPAKMLNSFIKEGYDVTVLTGNQNESTRKRDIELISKKIRKGAFDICYIESPVYPIMLHKDRKLIKKICKSDIPTGYFYRDFYRKFPRLFPRRKGIINCAKEFYLDIMQKLTDRVIRYCDIVYLPSERAKSLFKYKDMRVLPPAGDNKIVKKNKTNNTVIYVGGVTEIYGFDKLFNGIKIAQSRNDKLKAILVCRKKEWDAIKEKYKDIPWLEVYHVSGNKLEELYARADIGILTKHKNEYNDMAVSVKLFEYISFGLPVVSTQSDTTDEIINNLNIGLTVADDPENIAKGIIKLLNNNDYYFYYYNQIQKSLTESCLWRHRVKKIINDLMEK